MIKLMLADDHKLITDGISGLLASEENIEIGVKGYFLKTISKKELMLGINKVYLGGDYFSQDISNLLENKTKPITSITQDPIVSELSARELEIIRIIANGFSNKEIADKLYISPRTVETHRNNIMNKLGIHNVAGIVSFAYKNKIVD